MYSTVPPSFGGDGSGALGLPFTEGSTLISWFCCGGGSGINGCSEGALTVLSGDELELLWLQVEKIAPKITIATIPPITSEKLVSVIGVIHWYVIVALQ